MIIIKKYNQFVNESKEVEDVIIIPKGEELFHGTLEDFDIKDIRVGGYDGIFWTSKYPAISQTYIPVSGTSMITRTEHFHRPVVDERSRDLQRQLGINYDYDEVKFDGNRATSWRSPVEWKEKNDAAYEWREKHMELGKKVKAKREELKKMDDEFIDNHKDIIGEERDEWKRKRAELYNEVLEMESEYEKQSKEYQDKGDSKKWEYEYINNALRELGYKPKDHYGSDNNYTWDLKIGSDENKTERILPADYRAQGRLLIITPKEDLRIFDYAKDTDGDLMDLDYHKIDIFRKVEEKGFDGIRINDFAQIEGEGNFGHDSIGLFESTIPKLDIVSVPAVHPPNFYDNHIKTRDYETKEYKEYKYKK